MRVALFATCLIDALFPDAGKATVQILERLGQPVEFPLEQTCCGQMHANSGYFEPNLVRRYVGHVRAVRRDRRPLGLVRRRDPPPARDDRARCPGRRHSPQTPRRTADKTYELSEFLIDVLHTDDVGAYFPHRVTYHPTCHSLRMLHIADRPYRLLKNVRGIELSISHATRSAAASAAPSRSRTPTCRRPCWRTRWSR